MADTFPPSTFDVEAFVAELAGALVRVTQGVIAARVATQAAHATYAQVVLASDASRRAVLPAKLAAEAAMVTAQRRLAAEVNYIQELIGGNKTVVDPTPPPRPQ